MKTLPRSLLKFGIIVFLPTVLAALCVFAKPRESAGLAAGSEAKAGKGSIKGSLAPNPKIDQTITFENLPSKTVGDPPFEVSATASSGLELTITASGHCTVEGLTVQLAGAGSCTLTASQDGNDDYNPAVSISRSFFIGQPGENVFDVKSFGATGDGITDDAPAFQQALNELGNVGGGTLFVPPGRYAMATPVGKAFSGLASSVVIRGVESNTLVNLDLDGIELAQGLELTSEIYPRTGASAPALTIMGLRHFLVSDIAFVGTEEVETDAAITLYLPDVDNATIHHCEFYGLRSFIEGGAIVFALRSGLHIEQSKFLGSFGNSGTYTPDVQNIEWKSISISDVAFIDYGSRPELYCKCQGATYSWVNVGNAAPSSANSPRREVSFQNVFMDEGAFVGISSLPSFYQPPSAPIDLIYITGLRMNVSNFGTTGNYLWDLEHVLIEKSKYGWSHNAESAIQLTDAGTVIIDQAECVEGASRIMADAATQSLTVINSLYADLISQAQQTKTLTVDPEEDPVQIIRSQFEQVLGRVPDPAAHFYWSNLLLQCGDDAECVSDRSVELSEYLSATPSANFSIGGQIKDENNAPLSNVVVNLTGSQSVTTQTDSEGRYSFAGLPTSGIYTVTPSRPQYTFEVPSSTIVTPARDEEINFAATHHRYLVSGRIVKSTGLALGGASVVLSGSASGTTTTDVDGSYSFLVEAEGNYTITPSKANYSFSPAAATLNNLSENQTNINFTDTPVNYTVSGRLTSNGAGLSGVTLALSGSKTGTTTTDASGNFSFSLQAEENYTITPSKANYSFSPAAATVNNLSGNQTAINFTGALVNYVVSGRVTSNGAGLSGVTLALSGSKTGTTTTDASGNFSFSLQAEGNYTITPAKGNYSFSPAATTVNNLSGNQTALNFTGMLPSSIKVTSSANPVNFGQTVTFTATVSSASGTPTGTVQFQDNGVNVGSLQSLAGGVATLSTSALTGGAHGIVAIYSGDSNYLVSSGTLAGGQSVLPMLSIDDASIIEGNFGTKTLTFTVTLSPASNQTVTVNYASADGTATLADTDYQAASGTVSFNPGDLTKTVTVSVNGDEKFEPDEIVMMNLTSPVNGTISDSQGIGTILSDDTLQLLLSESGPEANQAEALDSLLFLRGPFTVRSIAEWLEFRSDRNTRVFVFVRNLQPSGEQPTTVILIDSSSKSYEVIIEDVRPLPNSDLTQVRFRLPENLSAGPCVLSVKKANGQISNSGFISIAP